MSEVLEAHPETRQDTPQASSSNRTRGTSSEYPAFWEGQKQFLWTLGVIISGHYHQIPIVAWFFVYFHFTIEKTTINHHCQGILCLVHPTNPIISCTPAPVNAVAPTSDLGDLVSPSQPFDLVMARSVLNFFASPRHDSDQCVGSRSWRSWSSKSLVQCISPRSTFWFYMK